MHASTGRDITTATKMHFIVDCGQGIIWSSNTVRRTRGSTAGHSSEKVPSTLHHHNLCL